MARSHSFVGLSPAAKAFINENCATDSFMKYKNGEKIAEWDEPRKIQGKYFIDADVFLAEDLPLDAFVLKNGQVIYEKVQCEPWSSGPCTFTHLVDENDVPINGTSWTEREISENLGESYEKYDLVEEDDDIVLVR